MESTASMAVVEKAMSEFKRKIREKKAKEEED